MNNSLILLCLLMIFGASFARRPVLVIDLIHQNSLHSPFRQNTSSYEPTTDITSPLKSAKVGFQARMQIGSNRLQQFLFMDTGSSLLTVNGPWDNAPEPVYHPRQSSTYLDVHCYSLNCRNLWVTTSCSKRDLCNFEQYFPGNFMRGRIGLEAFWFGVSDYITPHLLFGSGKGFTFANGVLGLGPGPVSLPSQVDAVRFGYCIGNISDIHSVNSFLSIGDDVGLAKAQTPLIINVKYYITLKSIIYGDLPLKINDPHVFVKGGMIVDSGSIFTFLPNAAVSELIRHIRYEHGGYPGDYGHAGDYVMPVTNIYYKNYQRLCYRGSSFGDFTDISIVKFVFEGGATLDLSPEHLFQQYDPQTFCLGIIPSESQGFTFSILGNLMMQYHNLVFDIGYKILTIEKSDCRS